MFHDVLVTLESLSTLACAMISTVDWPKWVPIASAAIAVLALVVSISNRNTARLSLRLAQAQEDRRAARLDVTLIEGISWRPQDEGFRWICTRIRVVNPSDRDCSLVSADLHIRYGLGTAGTVSIKVEPRISKIEFPSEIRPAEVPIRLQANGAMSIWFTYCIDDGLIPGPIDSYTVVLEDSRGPRETVQAWVMREIDHAT